jgi:hypothetical protein
MDAQKKPAVSPSMKESAAGGLQVDELLPGDGLDVLEWTCYSTTNFARIASGSSS